MTNISRKILFAALDKRVPMTDTDTLSTISIWRLIFPKRVNVNVILPKILDVPYAHLVRL